MWLDSHIRTCACAHIRTLIIVVDCASCTSPPIQVHAATLSSTEPLSQKNTLQKQHHPAKAIEQTNQAQTNKENVSHDITTEKQTEEGDEEVATKALKPSLIKTASTAGKKLNRDRRSKPAQDKEVQHLLTKPAKAGARSGSRGGLRHNPVKTVFSFPNGDTPCKPRPTKEKRTRLPREKGLAKRRGIISYPRRPVPLSPPRCRG